jgi:hypothetical protein
MEAWNREQLYAEVWQEPVSKLSNKYGVSGVMIGKICRKLKIPLPGRGYWARKQFGKAVERVPLPEAKDLPVLMRHTFPAQEETDALGANNQNPPAPEPTDGYYKSILEMESRSFSVNVENKRH